VNMLQNLREYLLLARSHDKERVSLRIQAAYTQYKNIDMDLPQIYDTEELRLYYAIINSVFCAGAAGPGAPWFLHLFAYGGACIGRQNHHNFWVQHSQLWPIGMISTAGFLVVSIHTVSSVRFIHIKSNEITMVAPSIDVFFLGVKQYLLSINQSEYRSRNIDPDFFQSVYQSVVGPNFVFPLPE
jgi:hypothetical protein